MTPAMEVPACRSAPIQGPGDRPVTVCSALPRPPSQWPRVGVPDETICVAFQARSVLGGNAVGAYNTVTVERLDDCSRCGERGEIRVQFKYGDTQQHHYRLGDTLLWGGNDIGDQAAAEVVVLGTPEYCGRCGLEVPGEYVVTIRAGQLIHYRFATPDEIATLP